jgi:GNAT superfamily N-acetyltransferase
MEIRLHEGDRQPLLPLFQLADDSAEQVASYHKLGVVLIAVDHGEPVGHLQLVDTNEDGVIELKSMAVIADRRGTGIGRMLIAEAVQCCRERAARRLVVSTAAADTGNLRFYQRMGFRMLRIERDAFSPQTGYPEGILIDQIPLRDRVWLDREL